MNSVEERLTLLADVSAPASLEDAVMQSIQGYKRPFSPRRLALAGACFALWLFTVQGIIGWTTAQLT